MQIFFDLDWITPDSFYQIYKNQFSLPGAEILLLNSNTIQTSGTVHSFLITDSDSGILRSESLEFPVIAWRHEYNSQESLMGASWLILSPESLSLEYLAEIDARFHHRPLQILESRRCILRELTSEDLPYLLKIQSEGTEDGHFFPEQLKDMESCSLFLKNYIEHQYPFFGFGIYAVLNKEDNRFLGIAGFSETETSDVACISYSILPEYRCQGYSHEIITELLPYAKSILGFSTVVAMIKKENTTSLHLAEKCGIQSIVY